MGMDVSSDTVIAIEIHQESTVIRIPCAFPLQT